MGTMSHFAYRGKHIQLKDFRSLYKTENRKNIQDKFKKSCLFPRKIIVIDDGKDGGCDDDHVMMVDVKTQDFALSWHCREWEKNI